MKNVLGVVAVAACGLVGAARAAKFAANSTGATYTNPVLDGYGADPWVVQSDGYYYMTYTTTTANNITLFRSKTLTNWNNAESKLLFLPPNGTDYVMELWAPEIHNLNGKWYVIFTANPYGESVPPQIDMLCTFNCPAVDHRMYVLESSSSSIWDSSYTFKSQLNTFDQFAIDGTFFVHGSSLYHIYSCWYSAYESWPANLCITQLSDPWTVTSNLTDRQIISVPTSDWEKTPYGRTTNVRLATNEGPEQLVNSKTGQNFVIFSGGRSDNPNYCLGQLELKEDGDPMNAQDWVKHDGCVFYQNKKAPVSGVGHASFVKSPDGKEDWIVYHGMEDPWEGGSARSIRAQKFTWNDDGTPAFPRPGVGPYQVPSGQVGS